MRKIIRALKRPPKSAPESAYDHLHKLLHQVLESNCELKETMMTTRAENAENARALAAQVNKAKGEILAKIEKLEAAQQASGNLTAEEESAMSELKTAVQGVDDIEPDATE